MGQLTKLVFLGYNGLRNEACERYNSEAAVLFTSSEKFSLASSLTTSCYT